MKEKKCLSRFLLIIEHSLFKRYHQFMSINVSLITEMLDSNEIEVKGLQ